MRVLFFFFVSFPVHAFLKRTQAEYSHTTKVTVDGQVVGIGNSLNSQIGQCKTNTGDKVQEIEVCGCEVKVNAYLKTRCGEYNTYQKEVGQCDCSKGSACVKVALKHGADNAHDMNAMSYRIDPC